MYEYGVWFSEQEEGDDASHLNSVIGSTGDFSTPNTCLGYYAGTPEPVVSGLIGFSLSLVRDLVGDCVINDVDPGFGSRERAAHELPGWAGQYSPDEVIQWGNNWLGMKKAPTIPLVGNVSIDSLAAYALTGLYEDLGGDTVDAILQNAIDTANVWVEVLWWDARLNALVKSPAFQPIMKTIAKIFSPSGDASSGSADRTPLQAAGVLQ